MTGVTWTFFAQYGPLYALSIASAIGAGGQEDGHAAGARAAALAGRPRQRPEDGLGSGQRTAPLADADAG